MAELKTVFYGATSIISESSSLGDRIYSSPFATYTYKAIPIRLDNETYPENVTYSSSVNTISNERTVGSGGGGSNSQTLISVPTYLRSTIYGQATNPIENIASWVSKITISGLFSDSLSDDRLSAPIALPTFLGNGVTTGARVYRRDAETLFVSADIGLIYSGAIRTIKPLITDLEAAI